jgi:hypothetical protein
VTFQRQAQKMKQYERNICPETASEGLTAGYRRCDWQVPLFMTLALHFAQRVALIVPIYLSVQQTY